MRLSRNRLLGMAVTLALTAALLAVGGSVLRWLRLYWPRLPGWLFWFCWLLPDALFALTSYVPRGRWKNFCRRVGEVWFTIILYPLGFLLLAGLAGLLFHLPLREAGWCVLALSALVLLCAMPPALFPRVTEYVFPMPGLSEPMKLALLSDLHLGFFTPRSLPSRIRDLVNAQSCDAVLIAGDIFDEEYAALRRPDEAARALAEMRSVYGTFACEGNHDNYSPSPQAEDFLRRADVRMLRDEWTQAGPLQLAGRLDRRRRTRRGAEELMADADPRRPAVVLDHNPREWDRLLDAGADLVLCGHTHGGQTFPGNLLLRLLFRFPVYGERVRGAGRCIVTSGVGVMGLPVRLGVRGEIAVLRLLPEESSPTKK